MPSQLETAYRGKRVFLTGHTGFKGSWLAEWLLSLGAEVHGYALDPQPHETLYDQLGLGSRVSSDTRKDLSDLGGLKSAIAAADPHFVLHLAAQPLVRLSYEIPVETFATNVLGTANLLEAVRLHGKPCSVVCVTTDKCYENREWLHAYREEDPMGGHDPYSASKGAAELVISSYRNSFFSEGTGIHLASARAGNVIGGGDWATDRIIPDCIRAIRAGKTIPVRNKIATRPWQHVLEPLSGYLWLAACMSNQAAESSNSAPPDLPLSNLQPSTFTPSTFTPSTFPPSDLPPSDLSPSTFKPSDSSLLCSAFNFGPALTSNRTVAELVAELLKHLGGKWEDASDPNARHEASKLNLATDKAFHLLQWQPVWNFAETIQKTSEWYLEEESSSLQDFTLKQITTYQKAAANLHLPWATSLNTEH